MHRKAEITEHLTVNSYICSPLIRGSTHYPPEKTSKRNGEDGSSNREAEGGE